MKAKYLILDFGKVLAYPVTGDWFITPLFYEYVNKDKIDKEKFHKCMVEIGDMLGGILKNVQEEYVIFIKFYKDSLINAGYIDKNINDVAKKCAHDFVFNNDKYKLYDDVIENLEKFSKEYRLICLSDNWPSGERYMKDMKIYDLFEKVYISSDYGYTKYEKIFFDHPIEDFKIKKDEAIFVDDSIELMDIAKEKGLIPVLMDRENKIENCAFKKVNCLKDIDK